MAYSYDIYELYKIINYTKMYSLQLASLSCRPSVNTSSNTCLCCYYTSNNLLKLNNPIELLYAFYSVIDSSLLPSINSLVHVSSVSYSLYALFSPTCPLTVTEIDVHRTTVDETYDDIVRYLKELYTANNVLKPNDNASLTSKTDAILANYLIGISINELNKSVELGASSLEYNYLIRYNDIVNNSIMHSCQILQLLYAFIEYLSTLYLLDINVVLIKNTVTTAITGEIHRPIDSKCGYAAGGYKIFLLVNLMTVDSKNSNITVANTVKPLLKPSKEIEFSGLVRVTSLPPNSQKMLVEESIISNGNFQYTVNAERKELFDKDKIKQKCKEDYNLEEGKLASRSNVLMALYDIFNEWLNHTNVLYVNINICHSNCHSNTMKIEQYIDNGGKELYHAGTIDGT